MFHFFVLLSVVVSNLIKGAQSTTYMSFSTPSLLQLHNVGLSWYTMDGVKSVPILWALN